VRRSKPTFIQNAMLILPERLAAECCLLIDGGKIAMLGGRGAEIPPEAEIVDAGGSFLSPGFIDIHVHGGGGADFMDGSTDAVETALATHTRHGTTTIFPTTTTGTPEQINAMLAACSEVKARRSLSDGARLEGVHFYGPYFAPEKCGIHADSGRRDPIAEEYRAAFDRDIVRIATCAAELPGAVDFYREASERGYLVTCGHSNASWSEMQAAFDAGMRHVDHFWCAMSSVASVRGRLGCPMQGSMEQFVLANRDMSTEVLADGEHLSPELLRFAFQFKGPEKLCLVTDASRAVDMPVGEYRFGPASDGIVFHNNGRVGEALEGGLASTVVGMDHMVRQMAEDCGAELHEVIRMASLTPAELTNISDRTGSLEEGKDADLVLLDQDLQVQRVWVGGVEQRLA
jgi:N-acetylglucosamine-6-phosphate deacetylase